MSAINEILGQLPLGDMANQLGVSQNEAKSASTQVITSLLGGLTNNAQQSSGADSLAAALVKHAAAGQSFASNGVRLDKVDTEDGSKIVKHTLGASTPKAAAAIAEETGSDPSLLQKLLPMLAPVVMAYVANKAGRGAAPAGGAGNMVGSLVGGLLGGGSGSSPASAGLGSMLTGLLGGALSGQGPSQEAKPKQTKQTKQAQQAQQAQQSSGGLLGNLLKDIL